MWMSYLDEVDAVLGEVLPEVGLALALGDLPEAQRLIAEACGKGLV